MSHKPMTEHDREKHKEWRSKNREKIKLQSFLYGKEHRQERNDYNRLWRNKNKSRVLAYAKKWRDSHKESVKKTSHKSYLKNRSKHLLDNKKWMDEHAEERKIYMKKWINEHRVQIANTKRNWNKNNKERVYDNRRKREKLNRKHINEKHNIYLRKRYICDPKFRVECSISSSIGKCLRGEKSFRHWESLVGYTIDDLMKHLESLFTPEMSWENYGSYWDIDHIKPKSLFHYTTTEDQEFKDCWALSNLQPLEHIANIKKNNKYDD